MKIQIDIERIQEDLKIYYPIADLDIFNERINKLTGNETIHCSPYFIKPVSRSIGVIDLNIILILKSMETDEVICLFSALVSVKRMNGETEEEKDLWLLVCDCLDIIQTEITNNNFLNKFGNQLRIPVTPGASDSYKGWIEFHR